MPHGTYSDGFVLCKPTDAHNEDFELNNLVSEDEQNYHDDPRMESWRDRLGRVKCTVNSGKDEVCDFLLTRIDRVKKSVLKLFGKFNPNIDELLVHYFGIDS